MIEKEVAAHKVVDWEEAAGFGIGVVAADDSVPLDHSHNPVVPEDSRRRKSCQMWSYVAAEEAEATEAPSGLRCCLPVMETVDSAQGKPDGHSQNSVEWEVLMGQV